MYVHIYVHVYVYLYMCKTLTDKCLLHLCQMKVVDKNVTRRQGYKNALKADVTLTSSSPDVTVVTRLQLGSARRLPQMSFSLVFRRAFCAYKKRLKINLHRLLKCLPPLQSPSPPNPRPLPQTPCLACVTTALITCDITQVLKGGSL